MPDVVVKPTAGQPKVTVSVDDTSKMTVAQLKERLAEDLNCPQSQQRLIYKGQILQDDKTVSDYGAATTLLTVTPLTHSAADDRNQAAFSIGRQAQSNMYAGFCGSMQAFSMSTWCTL